MRLSLDQDSNVHLIRNYGPGYVTVDAEGRLCHLSPDALKLLLLSHGDVTPDNVGRSHRREDFPTLSLLWQHHRRPAAPGSDGLVATSVCTPAEAPSVQAPTKAVPLAGSEVTEAADTVPELGPGAKTTGIPPTPLPNVSTTRTPGVTGTGLLKLPP